MNTAGSVPESIDQYIAGYPPNVQKRLQQIRKAVIAAAPAAQEKISYRIPAFMLHGQLVYFAAYKEHIGVYPRPKVADKKLAKELSRYTAGKGTFQFPLDEPLPIKLIGKIVRLRIQENLARAAARQKK